MVYDLYTEPLEQLQKIVKKLKFILTYTILYISGVYSLKVNIRKFDILFMNKLNLKSSLPSHQSFYVI